MEDEKGIQQLQKDILEKAGAKVTALSTGDEAVGLNDQWDQFDLLITDIVMPGSVQGDALARQFSDQCPSTPVIMLSGNPEIMNSLKPAGSELMLVLSKPIQRNELLAAISSLVLSGERHDPSEAEGGIPKAV